MASTTMVHVRIDEHLKAQATKTLADMGLSVSDAVRVFLTRVVAEQQLPFALKTPNAETRAAMTEADEIARARRVRFGTAAELFDDLEKNHSQSALPVATSNGLCQILPQRLETIITSGPVRHEPAQGSHAPAHCQRRSAWPRVARSPSRRGVGGTSRMSYWW